MAAHPKAAPKASSAAPHAPPANLPAERIEPGARRRRRTRHSHVQRTEPHGRRETLPGRLQENALHGSDRHSFRTERALEYAVRIADRTPPAAQALPKNSAR